MDPLPDRFTFFTIPELTDQNLCQEDLQTILREFNFAPGHTGIVHTVTEEMYTQATKHTKMIMFADTISEKRGEHIFTAPIGQTGSEGIIPGYLHNYISSTVNKLLTTPGTRNKWSAMTVIRGYNLFEPMCKPTLLTLNLCYITFDVSRVGWWPWLKGVKQVKVEWRNVHVKISPIFLSLHKLYA